MVMDARQVSLPDEQLLSLERSVASADGRIYHSDHPPIYARLDVK
jgi:hypothetical protein